MGWLTQAGTPVLKRKATTTERTWIKHFINGIYQYSGYKTRTITTEVYEYNALTKTAAENLAASTSLNYDNTDEYGAGTKSTATAEQQNQAGAYRVVQTKQTIGSWSEEVIP